MKFTKEELSLCTQIAEKYRKEIGKGDWYIANDLILLSTSDAWVGQADIIRHTPLWTISDCLEFLRDKGHSLETHEDILPSKDVYIEIHKYIGEMDMVHIQRRGKTDLEACLKAVLAVLEEEK